MEVFDPFLANKHSDLFRRQLRRTPNPDGTRSLKKNPEIVMSKFALKSRSSCVATNFGTSRPHARAAWTRGRESIISTLLLRSTKNGQKKTCKPYAELALARSLLFADL